MDNSMELNMMACFKAGVNLIISYNDFSLARLEISYLIQRLIEYRDLYPRGHKPFLFIEEAHKVFGEGLLDDFVLVFRKLGIGLCIVMPEVESLSSKVMSDIKTMIIGKYKGTGANTLISVIDHPDAGSIKRLQFNRFTGKRQFVFYTTDDEYLFVLDKVYESPCEIHRV